MVISQTPLRVSFLGGGTDLEAFYQYEDGCIVSSAIDKFVYVIVKERFDDLIYLNYTQKEIVDSVDEIKHNLIREAMKKAGITKGVEVTTLADIPSEGSGLGSSSSITVGLLNAFYAYQDELITAEALARQACEIEIDILRKPIGKQDQYIAAYGGLRMFTFKKDRTVGVEKLQLSATRRREFGANLLLFYTGKTRSASKILSKQRERTRDRIEVLRNMKLQAIEARRHILNNSFDEIGRLMRETWECKKQLATGISNGEIDALYQRALDAGAIGGKISGAGGGGFLLLYCPRERQRRLRQALKDLRELPFFLERGGSKIIFNVRRYDWKQ